MRTLLTPADSVVAAPGPVGSTDPAALLAAGYPWPAPGVPWLRAMMLVTLDGAFAGPDGHSRSISAPVDRDVLAETRRLADAVLVGAGTLRAERYGPLRARPDAAVQRRALGLGTAPTLCVVSGSLDLPWDLPLFDSSALRPLVVTGRAAAPALVDRARERADVEVLATDDVEPVGLLGALRERGLARVVCEGGPTLLARLMAAGVVDEVDVTLAPRYVGGGQVVTGTPFAAPVDFGLVQVLEDSGFLFTRMLRRAATDDARATEAAGRSAPDRELG